MYFKKKINLIAMSGLTVKQYFNQHDIKRLNIVTCNSKLLLEGDRLHR